MKKLLLACRSRQRRLRRRLLVQAKGLAADDLASMRWRRVLGIGGWLLRHVPVLYILFAASFVLSASSASSQLFFFLVSVWIGLMIAEKVGLSLIPPKDGPILTATPATNAVVWRLSTYWVPGSLFLSWLLIGGVLLSYGMGMGKAFVTSLAWLITPIAILGVALLLRGRATSLFRFLGGGLLGVVILSSFTRDIPAVREVIQRMSEAAPYLPANWLKGSVPGAMGAIAVFIFTVSQWYQWKRSYCFRPYVTIAPNLVRPITPANKKTVSNEAKPRKKGGLFAPLLQVLWTQEEKAIGRTLGYRFSATEAALPLLVIALIVSAKQVYPKIDAAIEAQQVLFLILTVGASIAAIVLSWRGWLPGTRQIAFYRLPCNGGRQVSVLGVFPISESQLFRMYLKELVIGEFLWIPIRLWILFTVLQVTGLLMKEQLPWPLLVFIFLGPSYEALRRWTQSLWQAVELYPETLKGILLRGSIRYFYVLPLVGIVVGLLFCSLTFVSELALNGWFLLGLFFLTIWIFGGLILTRRNFRKGKGSLIVKPPQKSVMVRK